MRPLVKKELDKIVVIGIIVKVEEPTDFVSLLTYVWKVNDNFQVYLDPKDSNATINQDH